jgi:hypothetical protein
MPHCWRGGYELCDIEFSAFAPWESEIPLWPTTWSHSEQLRASILITPEFNPVPGESPTVIFSPP